MNSLHNLVKGYVIGRKLLRYRSGLCDLTRRNLTSMVVMATKVIGKTSEKNRDFLVGEILVGYLKVWCGDALRKRKVKLASPSTCMDSLEYQDVLTSRFIPFLSGGLR